MGQLAIAFVAALLFGVGLVVSGMTLPEKVVGFLDFTGEWDPSLALVMVGAIGVHGVLFRWIVRRPSPLFAARFQIPTRKDLDARLLMGAALFGAGWGLGGVCPGPGLVASTGGSAELGVFVLSMVAGMVAFRVWDAGVQRHKNQMAQQGHKKEEAHEAAKLARAR